MRTTSLENKSGLDDVTFMRAWAFQLAHRLYILGRGVLGIELFGSLARGKGTMDSDFDVIVCVEAFQAFQWLEAVRGQIRDRDAYGPSVAKIRRLEAMRTIGITPDRLYAATGIDGWRLDIFVYPPNWRDYLHELQVLGHHTDPNFMRNIARDALTFVPNQGFAFPIFPSG